MLRKKIDNILTFSLTPENVADLSQLRPIKNRVHRDLLDIINSVEKPPESSSGYGEDSIDKQNEGFFVSTNDSGAKIHQ